MPEFQEIDILKKISEGDAQIFKHLFDTYYSSLCNYARLFVKFPEIAEEIVQDTFIRIWESRESLNVETSLKAYLYRAVHNYSLNYLKNSDIVQKHTSKMLEDMKYHQELASLNFSGEILDKLVADELGQLLDSAIDSLPDQCRNIFCLSRYEQLTYQQIAEKLDISVNTVKTQMLRALDKLREKIKK